MIRSTHVKLTMDAEDMDFASMRNSKVITKHFESFEDLLFSQFVTKINHRGKRQLRLLILTTEALYIFKKNIKIKRLGLDAVQVLLLSIENVNTCVIRFHPLPAKKALMSPTDLQSSLTNNALMMEIPKRNAFTKALRESKPVNLLQFEDVNHNMCEKAFKDVHFTLEHVLQTQRAMVGNPSYHHTTMLQEEEEEDEDHVEVPTTFVPPPPQPAQATHETKVSLRARMSGFLISSSSSSPNPKPRPELPKRKQKKAVLVKELLRRTSAIATNTPTTTTYVPRCPPCLVPIGVVQPIWSLLERALEPLLLDATTTTTTNNNNSGIVRCADILFKRLGDSGPQSEEDAIQAIALLCFDKDAARALLQSLHENIPVLGGSALVDSLDALQRCDNVVVRKWAIKSLWKLLPMCMSEQALPITSAKWMAALNPETEELNRFVANEGEAVFIKTYFRARIAFGVHEKEPLKRIAKRKASFSVLGSSFPPDPELFPHGLTPVLVQQAFGQVLLQNMFDVQRRAAFTQKVGQQQHNNNDTLNVAEVGVTESDCAVVLELLLNALQRPDKPLLGGRMEVTGKRIGNTALLPTLMGMLVLLTDDVARQRLLKDVSLLLLRSETNLKTVLDIPDWQLLFVPLLQTIPKQDEQRTPEQRILHQYVLNLLTMIHTYCFKEPHCLGGPLHVMLKRTFRALAMFAHWNADTIHIAQWILRGLSSQLTMTARHWWHDSEAPEWIAFAQLTRVVEEFIFFYGEQVPMNTPPHPHVKKPSNNTSRVSNDNDEDDDDEEDDTSGSERDDDDNVATRAVGKRRKRRFSITPGYVLKNFTPVVQPLLPHEAKKHMHSFDWMVTEEYSRFGLHETCLLSDVSLLETLIGLCTSMGITGNFAEDTRRTQLLKTASKKQKSLLRQASDACHALMQLQTLLLDYQQSKNSIRIQQYARERMQQQGTLSSSSSSHSKVSKLGVKQAKLVATKLEANVLKQRQLAKQTLVSTNVQNASMSRRYVHSVTEKNQTPIVIDTVFAPSQSTLNAAALKSKKKSSRKNSVLTNRVRFYSSLDEETITAAKNNMDVPPVPRRPTLMLLQSQRSQHGVSFNEEEEADLLFATSSTSANSMVMDSTPTKWCFACGEEVDEFDCVQHADRNFHSACFKCDACQLPLLKSENPEENNLFFSNGKEFKKFCGLECKLASMQSKNVCPGCMCWFQAGDQAIQSCGRLFHVDHLSCTDCGVNLFARDHIPVQIEQGEEWPYCLPCHERRFKTCAKCNQGILPTDRAYDALGRVFHENHFDCFRCGNQLTKEFYVDGHGDNARALCFPCWNHSTSPRICCDMCHLVLGDSDDCVELGGKIYHASRCFVCVTCKDHLKEGEVFANAEEDMAPQCDACFYKKRGRVCVACHELILEDAVETESGKRFYHTQCFSCCECEPGLGLTGRYYVLNDSKHFLCERHWLQHQEVCSGCQLVLSDTSPVITLNTTGKKYHESCFVCFACRTPLLVVGEKGNTSTTTTQDLNVGPDNEYYCDQHANGVCAVPECQNPCWSDHVLFRNANNEFVCRQHSSELAVQQEEEEEKDPVVCFSCHQEISGEEGGLLALDRWYHLSCFKCAKCHHVFHDKEEFKTTTSGDRLPVHATCL